MEYKKINLNSYNIHLIKTDKFKTIDIKVVFIDKFKKEEITKRNFLIDMLTFSTKKYDTKRKLTIKCQDLYSLSLSSANFRIGNYLMTKIGITLLNPKYTEESMLDESFDLLMETFFNPNTIENHFAEKAFSLIKKDLETELLEVREQPKIYALSQFLKEMDSNKPYSYHGYCYEEDLEKITKYSLYEYYQKFLQTNLVDIYVVGDFDFSKMEAMIRNKFKITTLKKNKGTIIVKHDKIRKHSHKVIEHSKFNQSKLIVGLKLDKLTKFEFGYVSNLYNLILGGISDSLLMKNVRVKESLAYYIGSSLNKADNLIIISSGIEKSNFEKTVKIIKKTLKDIQNGKITDDDIQKGQKEYLSSLESVINVPGGIIDLTMANHLTMSDPVEIRRKKIMEVSKKDIIDFSKKVFLDTIYLLEDSHENL